jgi:hypothetical protein
VDAAGIVVSTVLARRQLAAAHLARAAEDLALWDRLLRALGQVPPPAPPSTRRGPGRPRKDQP